MKLIHITDTHLVRPGQELLGLDPESRLRACIADINTNHPDADLCVITGDLTHWGQKEAFTLLRQCLSTLAIPYRLILGNHDDRAMFLATFPEARVDADGFVQSVLPADKGHLLFLDTVMHGTHAGWYCQARQVWLRQHLQRLAPPLYLFMHHAPFPVGMPLADQIGLVQADEFRAVVEPFRDKIRHLFFGHLHRPINGSWLGIPFSTIRATSHQSALDFRPDATNLIGSHEPPAYAIALIRDDAVVIHVHDFLDSSPRFKTGGVAWEDWQGEDSGELVLAD